MCMLGGLCIVQSLLAYTPGIRAGLIIGGYRPSPLLGADAPQPHFEKDLGLSTVWGELFFVRKVPLTLQKIVLSKRFRPLRRAIRDSAFGSLKQGCLIAFAQRFCTMQNQQTNADLHWGFAPNPIFFKEVFLQSEHAEACFSCRQAHLV